MIHHLYQSLFTSDFAIQRLLFKASLLILAIFLFANAAAFAQWTKIGPYGGNVTCITVKEGMLYAGTGEGSYNGGVYRSSDGGLTWSQFSAGLPHDDKFRFPAIDKIAAKGSGLIAIIDTFPYFYSTKNQLWKKYEIMHERRTVRPMTVALSDAYYYLGTKNGVFISANNGNTWFRCYSGLPADTWCREFAFIASDMFVLTDSGVYRSGDSGYNWTAASNGLPHDSSGALLHIDAFAALVTSKYANLYAAAGPRIYRSTNGGRSWSLPVNEMRDPSSGQPCAITAICGSEYELYAGGAAATFRSTDGGTTWAPFGTGRIQSDLNCLAWNNNALLAGTSTGLLRMADGNTNWFIAGLTPLTVKALTISGSHIHAASNNRIFHACDTVVEWLDITNDLVIDDESGIEHIVADGANLYTCTWSNGFYLSLDSGAHWTAANDGLPLADDGHIVSFYDLKARGTDLYAATASGVYFTADKGGKWSAVNNGLPHETGSIVFPVYALALMDDQMYAGTYYGVYRLDDMTGTWSPCNNGIPVSPVSVMTAVGSRLHVASDNIIHTTSDKGTSWAIMGDPECIVLSLCVSGNIMCVGTHAGIRCSTDNGKTWMDTGTDMSKDENGSGAVSALMISNDHLYACPPCGGIWKRPLSELTVDVEEPADRYPGHSNLYQVYPNPCTDATTIGFELPNDCTARLTICDILGREVAMITEREFRTGRHSVSWNASSLRAGTYFVKLLAGRNLIVKALYKTD
jgi:photosystem II stability/assembly factor-like uncharacterized protein